MVDAPEPRPIPFEEARGAVASAASDGIAFLKDYLKNNGKITQDQVDSGTNMTLPSGRFMMRLSNLAQASYPANDADRGNPAKDTTEAWRARLETPEGGSKMGALTLMRRLVDDIAAHDKTMPAGTPEDSPATATRAGMEKLMDEMRFADRALDEHVAHAPGKPKIERSVNPNQPGVSDLRNLRQVVGGILRRQDETNKGIKDADLLQFNTPYKARPGEDRIAGGGGEAAGGALGEGR
jgi:hypothetical protein